MKSPVNYGGYNDPELIEIYERMLRETDFDKQRGLMREYETRIIDTQAHEFPMLWWYRIDPGAVLRAWMEDRPQPLHQSGLVQYLAG